MAYWSYDMALEAARCLSLTHGALQKELCRSRGALGPTSAEKLTTPNSKVILLQLAPGMKDSLLNCRRSLHSRIRVWAVGGALILLLRALVLGVSPENMQRLWWCL